MSLIIGTMLFLIALSIVFEWVLPLGFKERAGTVICWSMMFITMTFLTLSTVGLLAIIVVQNVLPLFS